MVTAADLAVMAATFATGGVHPRTKQRQVKPAEANYVLQNVLPEGLYEYSDTWIMRTGGRAYAKSGVGGGVLIVIPNVCGIGIFSPRLDSHGNSVRGVAAGVELAKALSPPLFKASGERPRQHRRTRRQPPSRRQGRRTRRSKGPS